MRITSDKDKLPIDQIHKLLNGTYWAKDRSYDTVKRAIENSECITAWDQNKVIGFLRIVTDYSTVFWLCDVVVDPSYRGQGIGKAMMDELSIQPYYSALKGILATDDAHGLYESYGFHKEARKMMIKDRK